MVKNVAVLVICVAPRLLHVVMILVVLGELKLVVLTLNMVVMYLRETKFCNRRCTWDSIEMGMAGICTRAYD